METEVVFQPKSNVTSKGMKDAMALLWKEPNKVERNEQERKMLSLLLLLSSERFSVGVTNWGKRRCFWSDASKKVS